MKRTLLIVALVAQTWGEVAGQTIRDLIGATFEARVIAVADGDTIDAIPVGEKRAIRFRLDGIDTPERGEPFSQEARNFTRVLLFDQIIRAEGRDVDRYGRLVVRVRVAGKDASAELLRAGLACHYAAFSSDAILARLEGEARAAGRGFWASKSSLPRCVAASRGAPGGRAAAAARPTQQAPAVFHGNTVSHVYHAPYCPNYNCKNCTAAFASEDEAKKAGFRPAGDCLGRR